MSVWVDKEMNVSCFGGEVLEKVNKWQVFVQGVWGVLDSVCFELYYVVWRGTNLVGSYEASQAYRQIEGPRGWLYPSLSLSLLLEKKAMGMKFKVVAAIVCALGFGEWWFRSATGMTMQLMIIQGVIKDTTTEREAWVGKRKGKKKKEGKQLKRERTSFKQVEGYKGSDWMVLQYNTHSDCGGRGKNRKERR